MVIECYRIIFYRIDKFIWKNKFYWEEFKRKRYKNCEINLK